MSRGEESRREERVRAAMPVRLGDSLTGVTRDVSASGIFFETDGRFASGSAIRFTIDIEAPGGKMALNCHGEIVRVEERAGRVGVAVRIIESVLSAAKPPPVPANARSGPSEQPTPS